MEPLSTLIENQYNTPGLYEEIIKLLEEEKVDLNSVAREDIAGVDEFHVRGAEVSEELASQVKLDHSRVLDVGCGQGDFLRSLQNLGVSRLEGIDFSPDMIDSLRASDIQGYCGTFPDFPGENDSYDMISMNNYLEHTLEPERELSKAYDLLAPGGSLVGEVPGFDSWERRLFGRYWGGNHVPRHTYQFNADFLLKLLQKAGYQDIEISHQLNTSHWALSVQNFLQRNRASLSDNPNLNHGRSRYYVPLLLAFIPVNLVCVLFRKSGCIRFIARKPRPETHNA